MTIRRKVALLIITPVLIVGVAIGIAIPVHHHSNHGSTHTADQRRWDEIDAHLPAVLSSYMHLNNVTAGNDQHDPSDLIPYDRYGYVGASLNGPQNVAVYVPPKDTWAQVNTLIRHGQFSIDWTGEPEIFTVGKAN